MFKIRDEQTKRMKQVMEKNYLRNLAAYIKKASPQLAGRMDDEELQARVAKGADKAREYGIVDAEGIAGYVGLSLAAGPEFDEEPAVRHFLATSEGEPRDKIRWLFQRVIEDLERLRQ